MVFKIERHILPYLFIIAAFFLAAIGSVTVSAAPAIKASAKVAPAELMAANKLPDMVEGDANAPITIIEYASLTCGHCADFEKETLPIIRDKYIKTGKVRFIFREFAFDPRATAGFMLARCAPQDRYFPLIQVLFDKQMEWAAPKDALTPLKQIAKLAGFTDETFNACLKNQTILEGVNASFERGKTFGVNATPTFFINGDMYEGALPADIMTGIIDKYL